MSDDPSRSRDDLDQLKRQKERLELKAQIAALSVPWWRRASLVAAVTAIVGAILPIKTAIEQYYGNEREFRLQEQKQENDIALQRAKQENDVAIQKVKQEHEIRMSYLDRFEVPGHRLQTLRFLLATATDARLLAWAREEQKIVQAQIDEIEKDLLAVAAKIEQAPPGKAREELEAEREELKRLKSVTTLRPVPGSGSAAE